MSSIISRLNDLAYRPLSNSFWSKLDHNLNEIFEDLNLNKPDYYLDAAKETSSKTIGEILIKIDPILDDLKPDAILVLGDTNSCLSVIAAKKKKILFFILKQATGALT